MKKYRFTKISYYNKTNTIQLKRTNTVGLDKYVVRRDITRLIVVHPCYFFHAVGNDGALNLNDSLYLHHHFEESAGASLLIAIV